MRLRNTLALAAAGGAMLLGVGTAAADDLDTDSLNTDSVSSSDPTDSVDTDSVDADSEEGDTDSNADSSDPLSNLKAPLGDSTKPLDLNGPSGLGI